MNFPCLTQAHKTSINVCMRTTLNIDDALLTKAGELTGERGKTALVRMGLEVLIQSQAARRLALMGATMPSLRVPARRRLEAGSRK